MVFIYFCDESSVWLFLFFFFHIQLFDKVNIALGGSGKVFGAFQEELRGDEWMPI